MQQWWGLSTVLKKLGMLQQGTKWDSTIHQFWLIHIINVKIPIFCLEIHTTAMKFWTKILQQYTIIGLNITIKWINKILAQNKISITI